MGDILTKLAHELASGGVRVVDMTRTLGPDTQVIPLPPPNANAPTFRSWDISKYDEKGPLWYWKGFETSEHTGTHFDAPIHWITGRDLPNNSVDTIPVQQFLGPVCVIDLTDKVAANDDYLLTVEDVEAWESEYGTIPAGSWVLVRTGWSTRAPREFTNVREDGPHAPGITKECSLFLAETRDIRGYGVETISTDAGQAGKFDPPHYNHGILHGRGKFGLSSLCNLDLLPATGAILIAAPLKIVEGTASPLRVLALVPAAAPAKKAKARQ